MAGCMEPFGEYIPKDGVTRIIISDDQTVKLYNGENLIYVGKFDNFDDLKGTEYHNYENAIFVKPKNTDQSYIAFHISDNCKSMKAFVHRMYLERFGGESPKLDAKIYWKND